MKPFIERTKWHFLFVFLFMIAGIVACDKDDDTKDPDTVSIEVNLSFTSHVMPTAGQKLIVNLYYNDVRGISIIGSTPDKQKEVTLTLGNISTGVKVTFDDIPEEQATIYICAYVDINGNGELDSGDLAVFYSGVSLEEVELNEATPTNAAGQTSINIALDIIYAPEVPLTDIDGNIYQTVIIGNQEWMAENLRTTKFNNGDAIPTGHDAAAWVALMNTEDGTGSPAYAQNPEAIPEDGLLYNWFAAADSRNLCPTGWRVPTDDDWKTLETFAGMLEEELDEYTWRGAEAGVGTKLKSTRRGMAGTDDYGFDAIPSGMRSGAGTYSTYGVDFFYWSSTEDPRDVATYYLNGVRRAVRNSRPDVVRQGNTKLGGYAVRCVKDVD